MPFLRREHFVFLAVAYALSLSMWVSAWLLERGSGEDLVFNEKLVWAARFNEGSGGGPRPRRRLRRPRLSELA